MNLYIALDCSFPMKVAKDYNETNEKLNRAIDCIAGIVEEVDKTEQEIHLISFTNCPKVIKERVKTGTEVREVFSKALLDIGGNMDFIALRNLILKKHTVINFELIIFMNSSHYIWVPDSFRLPCIVHFVAVAERLDLISRDLITDFEKISLRCAYEAGIDPPKGHSKVELPSLGKHHLLYDQKGVKSAIRSLVQIVRTKNSVELVITPALTINVTLVPGLPKSPLIITEHELPLKKAIRIDRSSKLRLIGFIKSTILLNIPATPMIHCIKPHATSVEANFIAFHLFAETLGSEGKIAVFQHSSGEECVVKPLREDISRPWMLCLQFIPTDLYKWELQSSPAAMEMKKPIEDGKISYKSAATRTYWTDAHSLQTDIQKMHRILKRPDRIEQFYQEIQRISQYALACGYHSFAPILADMLEKRCAGVIPQENQIHLAKFTEALRNGGFKVVNQWKVQKN